MASSSERERVRYKMVKRKVSVDAVYEKGLLRPLRPLKLAEHQRVRITIEESVEEGPEAEAQAEAEEALRAWEEVYAGLSEGEIAELEALILDRSSFMRPER